MSVIGEVNQKLKGNVQKVRGTIKYHAGYTVGGTIDRLKGAVNDAVADVRLSARKRRISVR